MGYAHATADYDEWGFGWRRQQRVLILLASRLVDEYSLGSWAAKLRQQQHDGRGGHDRRRRVPYLSHLQPVRPAGRTHDAQRPGARQAQRIDVHGLRQALQVETEPVRAQEGEALWHHRTAHVPRVRENLWAQVEFEGPPRGAPLRQKVSLQLLRTHFRQPEFHESTRQEDAHRNPGRHGLVRD